MLSKKEASYAMVKQVKQLLFPETPTLGNDEQLDDEILAAMCSDFACKCSINESLSSHVEAKTKKQSLSPLS